MQKHFTTSRHLGSRSPMIFSIVALAAAASVLPGCRDERTDEPPRQFIPDMDDSPKFKPQSETELFADKRTMRPPVVGTVAFGETSRANDFARQHLLKDSTEYFTGVDPNAAPPKENAVLGAAAVKGVSYVTYMPPNVIENVISSAGERGVTLDKPGAYDALFERGKERFNIFCSVCHGYSGEGGNPGAFTGGMAGRRWTSPVPALQDAKYKDRTQQTGQDGYIFHVIRNGVPDADPAKPPKMPAYKDRVSEADAWAIVYYVRVLQASWNEDMKNVPADLRAKLEASRPNLTQPSAAPGAGKETRQ